MERTSPSRADRAATRRRRITRIAVFGGAVLASLSIAAPAMAWPMCGW